MMDNSYYFLILKINFPSFFEFMCVIKVNVLFPYISWLYSSFASKKQKHKKTKNYEIIKFEKPKSINHNFHFLIFPE